MINFVRAECACREHAFAKICVKYVQHWTLRRVVSCRAWLTSSYIGTHVELIVRLCPILAVSMCGREASICGDFLQSVYMVQVSSKVCGTRLVV